MSEYRSRGQTFYYSAYGQTGCPCVVLLHGFTNYSGLWAWQAIALAYAGYRALVPDLAGHGLSQFCDAPTTVDDLTMDVANLLEEENETQAAVVGLSLGGMVALRFAVTFPDLTSSIVIANSSAKTNNHQVLSQIDDWIEILESDDGPVKRLARTWPMLCTAEFRSSPQADNYYWTWQNLLSKVPGSSLANIARGMKLFDMSQKLANIDCPSLIIAGEQDQVISAKESIALSDAIQGAELQVLPKAGHLATLDSPNLVTQHLLRFLACSRRLTQS